MRGHCLLPPTEPQASVPEALDRESLLGGPGFRVLTGNQQLDNSRISKFRRRKLDALKGLLIQILHPCQKARMVSLGHVALDGTKVQANASKHNQTAPDQLQGGKIATLQAVFLKLLGFQRSEDPDGIGGGRVVGV